MFWLLGGTPEDQLRLELRASSLHEWLDRWLDKAAAKSASEENVTARDWSLDKVAELEESAESRQFDPTLPPHPIAVMGRKIREMTYGSSANRSEEEEE